jgi:4-hydroxybenzoate polyprenyltransferase
MNWHKLKERLSLYEKLMRLDRPIGILLLLWPTLWGIWFASEGKPQWTILWIFVLGTALMRSAGCVINDYADRNFDLHVERTKNRPITSGKVSTKEALILAGTLALCAFLLILPLNKLVILLSFCALFLAISYPFTKRFLALPQAYLGIAFGFGIPMAFAAEKGGTPALAWILMLANIFWAIAYDTEYAMVDREDDLKIGIKSSAITFGKYDVIAVMICYVLMLLILTGIGIWQQLGIFYYLGLIAAAILIYHQFTLIIGRDRQKCFEAFLYNNWIGTVIFLGIALSYFK